MLRDVSRRKLFFYLVASICLLCLCLISDFFSFLMPVAMAIFSIILLLTIWVLFGGADRAFMESYTYGKTAMSSIHAALVPLFFGLVELEKGVTTIWSRRLKYMLSPLWVRHWGFKRWNRSPRDIIYSATTINRQGRLRGRLRTRLDPALYDFPSNTVVTDSYRQSDTAAYDSLGPRGSELFLGIRDSLAGIHASASVQGEE